MSGTAPLIGRRRLLQSLGVAPLAAVASLRPLDRVARPRGGRVAAGQVLTAGFINQLLERLERLERDS